MIYTGYVITKPELVNKYIWFGWLYYVNPIGYAFESVLTNELGNRVMDCSDLDLVPQGPNVNPSNQGCTLPGAGVNAHTVTGSAYLQSTFTYSRSHLWRNFGIILGFTVFYIAVTALATELFSFAESGGGALVFKKTRRSKQALVQKPVDEEKVIADCPNASSRTSSKTLEAALDSPDPEKKKSPITAPIADEKNDQTGDDGEDEDADESEQETLQKLSMSDSIFTWQNVQYTVPYRGGERKLLNKVSGYAKPGKMV